MPTTKKKTATKGGRSRAVGAKTASARRTSPRRTTARPARRQVRPQKPDTLLLRSSEPSLTVNDLERSLAWYRDTLGFKVKERWEHEGRLAGVELAAGKVSFYLSQDDWRKGRDRVKGEGFRLYCTTSQNVDVLAVLIRERGGRLLQEPHDEPWGGRALAVADPDGFKITITSE
jgi:lactoylglutathione lyase